MSWFRSSPQPDIESNANFETGTTLAVNDWLVPFDSEIRSESDVKCMRISESGH